MNISGSTPPHPRRRCATRRRRGVSIAWLLISLGLVTTLTGVGLDTAHLFLASQQVQNAADSAALAAARLVRSDTELARSVAIVAAQANTVAGGTVVLEDNPENDPAGDIVMGIYNRDTAVFTPTLLGPNAVLIRARRTADSPSGRVPLLLGAAVGLDGVDVVRTVIAMNSAGGGGAGLLTLGTTGCGLDMSGSPTLNVVGGAVTINSTSSCAFCGTGVPTVNADVINVSGGQCVPWWANINAPVNSNVAPTTDPLGNLPAPPIGVPMNPPGINVVGVNVVNAQPGYYPNGIRVGASGTLNMAPGIYIVGQGNGGGQFPPGFRVDGAGRVNGDGVMIYVLEGAVDLAGSGALNISPPDSSVHNFPGVETYEGISFFQARTNTTRSRIVGAAQMNLQGTLYMPNNELDLRGSGSGIGNQLIVNKLLMSGNPNVTVNYNGAFPTGTGAVFIVR